MTYVFSCIKEIKTMKLRGMSVVSELGRNIYSVRFMGTLSDIRKESTKLVLKLEDDDENVTTIAYPHISQSVEKEISNLRIGDRAIVFAHLEPTNKICYVDIIKKLDDKGEIVFLGGLFLTYFELAFNLRLTSKKYEIASSRG